MPILSWETKEEDLRATGTVAYRVLENQESFGDLRDRESFGDLRNGGDGDLRDGGGGFVGGGNLLVQGDNLAALKSLLPHYAGKVKCVCIDPPYNTGNAFAQYDDNLAHSLWLRMMYPRLSLLRDMLADDGSIWITIDDDEAHYLKVIMDEIFGRKNFVANVVWHSTKSVTSTAIISSAHTHILLYFKNKQYYVKNRLEFRLPENGAGFSNPDNDPRGSWKADPFQVGGWRPNQQYEIVNPKTGKVYRPNPGCSWKNDDKKFQVLLADNRIVFGKSGEAGPQRKRFLSEAQDRGKVATTIWEDVDATTNGTQHSQQLFGVENAFSNPKPEKLIQRILHLSTKPGDLVLDSFLGSGTTAAVAHKMGRRWIGIENGEHARTHCIPRLQKVIGGEQGGISQTANWTGGGGFYFVRLGGEVFDENGGINPRLTFAALAAHVWFCETRTPLPPQKRRTPFIGARDNTAYILLYNGILKDKSAGGGNVLTAAMLQKIRAFLPKRFRGNIVVYGNGCRLQARRLARENIRFRQIPYDCGQEKK